jgi:coatomer subunit beta
MQVDDLLNFQQFSKNSVDDTINVCDLKKFRELGDEDTHGFFPQYDEDVGRATGRTEICEDFLSNLSHILKLTSNYLL